MKNIFLFLFALAVTLSSFGQTDILNGYRDSVITYSDSVVVPGATKDSLFNRARDWLAVNGKTLKIMDREAGKIIAMAGMDAPVTIHYLGAQTGVASFDFILIILVKDGMYSYSITNIENIRVNGTNANGVFGMLYRSKHCGVKGMILTPAKLDQAYQSLKDGFDKNENGLVAFLQSSMKNQ